MARLLAASMGDPSMPIPGRKKPRPYRGDDYCSGCGGEKVVHRDVPPYDYIDCPRCKGSGKDPDPALVRRRKAESDRLRRGKGPK